MRTKSFQKNLSSNSICVTEFGTNANGDNSCLRYFVSSFGELEPVIDGGLKSPMVSALACHAGVGYSIPAVDNILGCFPLLSGISQS